MPRERGKWLLDWKCLEPGEAVQIAERKPLGKGIRPRLIQARLVRDVSKVLQAREERSVRPRPPGALDQSLEFPILWVWFVKCFSWKGFLWDPNLNNNTSLFPLKSVSNLFPNRETLSPVSSALFWVTSMVMKPASPRAAGPSHGPVLKRGVPSTQAYVWDEIHFYFAFDKCTKMLH